MAHNTAESQSFLDKTALLVVDMQPAFLKALPDEGRPLLSRCLFAVKAAKLLGMKVYHTEQLPEKLGRSAPELKVELPGKAYAKPEFSALRAEGLRARLEEDDTKHILIAGLETTICVYQTARDAHRTDLAATVLSDCVDCRRRQDAQSALDFLRHHDRLFVLPSETVFYSILETSAHPAFKAFTQLVKEHA